MRHHGDRVNDKTLQLVQHVLDQIQHTVVATAPIAFKLLLGTLQAGAIVQLALGIGWTIAYGGLAAGLWWLFVHGFKNEWWDEDHKYPGPGAAVFFGFSAVTFSIMACVTCTTGLTDPWVWVTAFHPELGLTHQILVKALGS